MIIGRKAVLMATLAALSSCSAQATLTPFTGIERTLDAFARRAVPQDDAPLSPPEKPKMTFPLENGADG